MFYSTLFLIFRYQGTKYYCKSLNNFVIGLEVFLFWVYFCASLHAIFDTDGADNMGLLYLALTTPIAVYCFFNVLESVRWNYLKINLRDISKPTQSIEYILNIIELIENRENI